MSSKPFANMDWRLLSLEVLAHKIAQTSAVLLLVNKPASELLNESLLTIANGQDKQQEPMALFYMYSEHSGLALTIRQSEHINCEFWLSIVNNWLIQHKFK